MAGTSSFALRTDANTDAGAVDRAIDRRLAGLGPSMLVQVKAVHNEGVSLTGTVDVQPMVHQQDALGAPQAHGLLYGVPYLRIQGGASAFICDPQVGDIGFVIVSGRDHSNAIANLAPSNPASFRMFDMADSVYVGGFLNEAPTQYIMMAADGIRIVAPNGVQITGNVTVAGSIKATRDIEAGNISLESHKHAGVETGTGVTGLPE